MGKRADTPGPGRRYRAAMMLAALLCADTLAAHAASVDSPALSVVRQFLQQQALAGALPGDVVNVEIQAPRVELPDCPHPRAFLPGTGQRPWGRVTVGLRCAGSDSPLRYLQARVTLTGRYWVAARALPANTALGPEVLEARRGDLGQQPGQAVRDLGAIRGQVTRRPLAKGTILRQAFIHTPPVVERRELVSVEARGSGFRVAREGRALDAGVEGDQVRVRMPDRETLQATVTGPGRVVVAW